MFSLLILSLLHKKKGQGKPKVIWLHVRQVSLYALQPQICLLIHLRVKAPDFSCAILV